MKLKCPACGAPISAADINVQQMVAVCPDCDNVFKFEGAFQPQRRKLKPPAQFQVAADDPDRLDMAFKWSWRTEPPVGLFGVLMGFFAPLFVILAMAGEGAPLDAMLIPLPLTALMSYVLLTLALNRTHYESDGETLQVYTEPLPFFRYGKTTVAVDEIDRVTVERPAYAPFPDGKDGFYDVFVHTLDGDKLKVAAIVNFQHAHFIAQEIEAHLQALRAAPALATDDDLVEAEESEPLADWTTESARKAARS